MIEQAKLFGILKFNAFNQASYTNIYVLIRLIELAAIFPIMYLIRQVSIISVPYIDSYEGFPEAAKAVILILIIALSLLIAMLMYQYFDKSLNYALRKVNADAYLQEFDLNIEDERARYLAQVDIEKNGYFSAEGYWVLKKHLRLYNRGVDIMDASDAEKKRIKEKYNDVFTFTKKHQPSEAYQDQAHQTLK